METEKKYGCLYYDYDNATFKRVVLSELKIKKATNGIDHTREIITYFDLSNVRAIDFPELIKKIISYNLDYVFVLNGAHFFAFIDTFALNYAIPEYVKQSADVKYPCKVNYECISRHDSDTEYFTRKLWLKVRGSNRHLTIKSTEFFNFSAIIGITSNDEISKIFGDVIGLSSTLEKAVYHFAKIYERITGDNFFTKYGPAVWTMGSAAKKFYLKLRYPECSFARLKRYQNTHPQNEDFEYQMREQKLLLPGTLYCKSLNVQYGLAYKYDINSLFPATEYDLNELGKPSPSTIDEFLMPVNDQFEYIAVIDNITLKVKKNMPSIFSNPFEQYTGKNDDVIFINQPWAVFKPFFIILQKFYNIADLSINKVYRLPKLGKDKALQKFIDILFAEKTITKKTGEKFANMIAKQFINNLHGKLAQKTYRIKYDYELDDGIVKKIRSPLHSLKDEWREKHFNFIQGAYVYTMSKVHYLNKLINTFDWKNNMREHIFYIDTDSVITDIYTSNVSDYKLGEFKAEHDFHGFIVFAPKVYFGYDYRTGLELVAAGTDKNAVLKRIAELQLISNDGILNHIDEIIQMLQNDEFEVKILTRTNYGAEYTFIKRKLAAAGTRENDF